MFTDLDEIQREFDEYTNRSLDMFLALTTRHQNYLARQREKRLFRRRIATPAEAEALLVKKRAAIQIARAARRTNIQPHYTFSSASRGGRKRDAPVFGDVYWNRAQRKWLPVIPIFPKNRCAG